MHTSQSISVNTLLVAANCIAALLVQLSTVTRASIFESLPEHLTYGLLYWTGLTSACSTLFPHRAPMPEAEQSQVQMQEEGIIIKALDSPWQMNDRSNAWLKIKPDYVHSNDIDAVIIGAFYGTGRHGGLVTQWLLALAEAPAGGGQDAPSNFMSFCK